MMLYLLVIISMAGLFVGVAGLDVTQDIWAQSKHWAPHCTNHTNDISYEMMEAFATKREWFHTIKFPNGITTKGYDPTIEKIEKNVMSLPEDLTGKTVLDVGTYNGAYAIEACRRGAEKVVAIDYFAWAYSEDHKHFRNFCFARQQSGFAHKIDYMWLPIEDLSPSAMNGQKFDYVFFFGILYHADNPIGYLRHMLSMLNPGSVMLLETVVDMLDVPYPALAFYEGDTLLNGDNTNDFGPNELAVLAMMRKAGFTNCEVTQRNYVNLLHGQMTEAAKKIHPPSGVAQNARSTFRGVAP